MVFRRRVKCCNPINNTFAITDFFENQFYANNQNDLRRSKNIDKSFACRRWALLEVNNDYLSTDRSFSIPGHNTVEISFRFREVGKRRK